MVDSDPELRLKPRDGTIHVHRVLPGDDQFEYWLDQREKYMRRMGWHLDSEHDSYDDDPNTAHLMITDEQGELIVGMRLTPVPSYQQSLSWDMLETAPSIRDQVVQSNELDAEQPVWDLTRLIQGETRFTPELSREAIGRLFSEGLHASGANEDNEPTWVFTITDPLFRLFSSGGMHLRQLGKGRIQPGDRTESVFGYVRTLQDLHDSTRSSIARTTIGALMNNG